jgi:hypothetical protein
MANNKNIEGGAEELDKYLFSKITTENDLEQNVDLFAEALQSPYRRTIQNTNTGKKKKNNMKSVPWWTDRLIVMRNRVNACIRL